MSSIIVTAHVSCLGLEAGQTVEVEQTELIDAHLASGHLVLAEPEPTELPVQTIVLESAKPTPAGKDKT